MSRIEDALRRVQDGSSGEASVERSQTLFSPAWSVSDDAGRAAGTAGTQPAVRRVDAQHRDQVPVGFSSEWRERLALGTAADPTLTEQFRRLAATLHHARQATGLRSAMITSATPGDGKTLTAVNLSLVLAESYNYKVLLMDADLRRPSIPGVIEMGAGSGLSEVLRATTPQKLALVPLTPRLTLLPAGQPISNSIEALTSPRMHTILNEAIASYDWVILDAPPVGPTADARLLTQMVGGVLFVVHAGQTQYADVVKAVDAIGKEQILGVVLNGVKEESSDGYYYGTVRITDGS